MTCSMTWGEITLVGRASLRSSRETWPCSLASLDQGLQLRLDLGVLGVVDELFVGGLGPARGCLLCLRDLLRRRLFGG